jgi:NADPH2:quinone reductase
MRAVVIPRFGEADALEVAERPEPKPAAGQVAIDVEFAGANYAEVLYRRGLVDVDLPFIPGIEVAGRIRELGDGVDGQLTAGQPVAALTIVDGGGYAEVAVTDADLVAPLPHEASEHLARLAGAPSNSTTALLVFDEVARLREGESVMVHAAAGGVGSQLGQAARLLGASRVVGDGRTHREGRDGARVRI